MTKRRSPCRGFAGPPQGHPSRAPLFLQALRLGIEHILQPVAGEAAAALDGGQLDDGQDMAIGGGIGQVLQFADHGEGLLGGEQLALVAEIMCGGSWGTSVRVR